uniref:Uncharacterized protein n=1 Tax=Myoviridae sp. ctkfK18 TaxID=2825165 RepID=A0A8S5VH14_9CAUD|nr:MAG TPA: hypothetical protein [Myoviridae sp. ctkfK18]
MAIFSVLYNKIINLSLMYIKRVKTAYKAV